MAGYIGYKQPMTYSVVYKIDAQKSDKEAYTRSDFPMPSQIGAYWNKF